MNKKLFLNIYIARRCTTVIKNMFYLAEIINFLKAPVSARQLGGFKGTQGGSNIANRVLWATVERDSTFPHKIVNGSLDCRQLFNKLQFNTLFRLPRKSAYNFFAVPSSNINLDHFALLPKLCISLFPSNVIWLWILVKLKRGKVTVECWLVYSKTDFVNLNLDILCKFYNLISLISYLKLLYILYYC